MNPTDNIKKMIKELILPGTKADDYRILNDALSTFEKAGPYKSTRINPQIRIWIKRAVAAVIVFSILIPLGYGASRVIRKLMIKPAWRGGFVRDFKPDKDIHFDLHGWCGFDFNKDTDCHHWFMWVGIGSIKKYKTEKERKNK